MYMYMYVYVYIHTNKFMNGTNMQRCISGGGVWALGPRLEAWRWAGGLTANPRANIVGFRGFGSSIILILRGTSLRPIGDVLESLSQAMLVGCNVGGEIGRSGRVPRKTSSSETPQRSPDL